MPASGRGCSSTTAWISTWRPCASGEQSVVRAVAWLSQKAFASTWGIAIPKTIYWANCLGLSESHRHGQRFTQPFQIDRSRNLDGSEASRVLGAKLDVKEPKAAFAHPFHQVR